jgi:hypothetical protein
MYIEAHIGHEFCYASTDPPPGYDGLSQAVAAKTIETVHIPARGFADGKQTGHIVSLAVFVNAHAAHRVMLCRPHRYQIINRIQTDEVATDLIDLAQLRGQVFLAQVPDVKP